MSTNYEISLKILFIRTRIFDAKILFVSKKVDNYATLLATLTEFWFVIECLCKDDIYYRAINIVH